jgi:iron(II)-dependent oxidoreductase
MMLVDGAEADGKHGSAFYIGKFEVTAGQFVTFLQEEGNPSERYYLLTDFSRVLRKDDEWVIRDESRDMPISTVTWYGAMKYCDWLSKKTGDTFRLPTEAEWEWAAKGPEGRKYPWGNAPPENRANWGGAWTLTIPWKDLPVGSFPNGSTPDGVHDMVGGVWEWCKDGDEATPAKTNRLSRELQKLGAIPPMRIMRGGMQNRRGQELTTTMTRMPAPAAAHPDGGIYGFRLLREIRDD